MPTYSMTIEPQTLPELNTEMLERIVTWAAVEARSLELGGVDFGPDWGTWNQEAWAQETRNGVCQTAFCIAGQAAHQAGYVMNLTHVGTTHDPVTDTILRTYRAQTCSPGIPTGAFDPVTGEEVLEPNPDSDTHRDIEFLACELLGMTRSEGRLLFKGNNSIGDIVKIATAIARHRGVTLDLPRPVKNLARGSHRTYDDLKYRLTYGL